MSAKFRLYFCVSAFFILHSSFLLAQGPAWWYARGVLVTNSQANNYAPIALGQLKWMATNACAEMNAYFGAGTNVTSLVNAFSNTNNYYPANVGQVKYVVQPFYDRLYELNLTNTFPANMPGYYPWGNAPQTNDYAMVNIGQVKYVFSFDSAKDSDSDGMSDWWEAAHGLNPYEDDAGLDPDDDGLTNLQEYQNGTDPNDADTDDDGIPDGWEVEHGLNPLVNDASLDPDNDGLTNLQEYQEGTNPQSSDTDGDGLTDGWEVAHGLNPADADTDGDELSDGWELAHGFDPLDDSDGSQTVQRETARQIISRHWLLFYGSAPVFTNIPGSPADLIDLKNDLNALSDKFYKVD
ncbi:MAG: hypothetical protein Q7J98_03320 [Kiritimatiellia bacterium]|nr:hypothetical protein [Kiritimatiellia bacterium]